MADDMKEILERLEALEEAMQADREMRELGHRVVWNDKGECNLPGMPRKSGEDLRRQLARQNKYY